jgi:hypothetical protein
MTIPLTNIPFKSGSIADIRFFDQLAEKEHDLWCEERLHEEWIYSPERSDYFKKHDCLIKFEKLDLNEEIIKNQTQKNKDRNAVRKYAEYLRKSELKLSKIT